MALAPAIVEAIRNAGPNRAVSNIAMLSDNVRAATATLRAVTGLGSALAALAGLLSAIGLYLVITFIVQHRRRTTAIRVVLGATNHQVMW